MRFGICVSDKDKFELVKNMGYDYVEPQISMVHGLSDEDYAAFRKALEASGLKAETFNIFIPKHLALTGTGVDMDAVRNYLEKALRRAAELGGQVVVFGSGGARNVPDGFPRERAMEQLAEFLNVAGDIAAAHGIVIAIEPLRRQECNIINTVTDGYELAMSAAHTAVRVLADNYHMYYEGERDEGLRLAGKEYLRHVHVSHPSTREAPRADDGADYSELFGTLCAIGYAGRISVEAVMPRGFETDAREALEILRAAGIL